MNKIFVKTSDPEDLFKYLSFQGDSYYRIVESDVNEGVYTVEAVYFSTSRAIYFAGKLDDKQFDLLRAQAKRAKNFSMDEFRGTIIVDNLGE